MEDAQHFPRMSKGLQGSCQLWPSEFSVRAPQRTIVRTQLSEWFCCCHTAKRVYENCVKEEINAVLYVLLKGITAGSCERKCCL